MTQVTPKPSMDARSLDGNIFSVVGRVQATLRSAGLRTEAQEVLTEVQQAGSYDQALVVCMKYVNFEFGAVSNVRRTDDSNKLPAGKYVVADPCYVLSESAYNDLLDSGDWNGEQKSSFGGEHGIWILPTAHGDGRYDGSNGHEFPVDSGHIAIIAVAPEYFNANWKSYSTFDVAKPFACQVDEDGVMNFGNFLTIETDPQYCGECGELVSYCGGEHEEEDEDEDEEY